MASRTKVTVENLIKLGAEKLAAILLSEAASNPGLKRELRLTLSAEAGPEIVAKEVGRRISSLGRARSFIDWEKRRRFVQDLAQQRNAILEKVAPKRPDLALELMWRFLEIGPQTLERSDDSSGSVGDVFRGILHDLEDVAPRASVDPSRLAEEVYRRLRANDYGLYDDLIDATSPALGAAGVQHLKEKIKEWQGENGQKPLVTSDRRPDWRHDHEQQSISRYLRDIADAEGNVDAYLATFDEDQRSNPVYAASIAHRLIGAGRGEEALAILNGAKPTSGFGLHEWTEAHISALSATKRGKEAQEARWRAFEAMLSESYLRDYLKELPDFDDVEAENKALSIVEAHPHFHGALHFLLSWPDLVRAAKLVLSRSEELDGNHYFLLSPAADALEAKHPLSAVVLRRALIEDTLDGGKSKRYRHAARHVLEIESLDTTVEGYGDFETHEAFMGRIRKKHGRKYGFWGLLKTDP